MAVALDQVAVALDQEGGTAAVYRMRIKVESDSLKSKRDATPSFVIYI